MISVKHIAEEYFWCFLLQKIVEKHSKRTKLVFYATLKYKILVKFSTLDLTSWAITLKFLDFFGPQFYVGHYVLVNWITFALLEPSSTFNGHTYNV